MSTTTNNPPKSNAPQTNKSPKPNASKSNNSFLTSINNSPRNSPQPKKSRLAAFKEKSRGAAEIRRTSTEYAFKRKFISFIPIFNMVINIIVILATLLIVWLPANEMPYRPTLLLPALCFALLQLGYLFFMHGIAEKIVIQQAVYVCTLVILTILAIVYPQRTCCLRTAKEPITERMNFLGPKCSGELRKERNVDGVWVDEDVKDEDVVREPNFFEKLLDSWRSPKENI